MNPFHEPIFTNAFKIPVNTTDFNPVNLPKAKPIKTEAKKAVIKSSITQAGNQREWKTYPGISTKPDFSYVKPKVDMSRLQHLSVDLQMQVKERCLGKMKEAMKALDPSMVDAINEMIQLGELDGALDTVDRFSNRILDLYEAYVAVQREKNITPYPDEIAILKSGGFTHEELQELQVNCQWYEKHVEQFESQLRKLGLSEKEAKMMTQCMASYSYNWPHNPFESGTLSKLQQEGKRIYKNSVKNAQIQKKCEDFSRALQGNQAYLKKIVSMDKKMYFCNPCMSQEDKETLKMSLAQFDPANASMKMRVDSDGRMVNLYDDPDYRLQKEVYARFALRDFETNDVRSPTRLIHIVRGKYKENKDRLYRIKLYFVYGSKALVNEIVKSTELTKQVNAMLQKQGKNWQIDSKVVDKLRKASADQPIFEHGTYAHENNVGKKTRHWASKDEVEENKKNDPNRTFAQLEKMARREEIKPEDLMERCRLQLSQAEEMAFFGTNHELDTREFSERQALLSDTEEGQINIKGNKPSRKPDTNFNESYLDYMKKNTRTHWTPGKFIFKLHEKSVCDSPYLNAIDDLGIPRYAGISGSTDNTLTMAGAVGIHSIADLTALRTIYIAWMSGSEDHTADEVAIALKSFGVKYNPAPDNYNQLGPSSPDFRKLVQEQQKARGYALPEFYLSPEYADQVLDEIVAEQKAAEMAQDKNVQTLMKNNQLLLQGYRTYRKNYSLTDPFGDAKWNKNINPVSNDRVEKNNKRREEKRTNPKPNDLHPDKFTLNLEKQTYEPYKRPKKSPYTGSSKSSTSLVPPKGKIIPYVPREWPHLNRVGLLYDANQSEYKESLIFSADANTDTEQKWKKTYTQKERAAPVFKKKLKKDAEDAIEFNKTKAHQTSKAELVQMHKENEDYFIHYNEILASIKQQGIVGVFTFSRGLPVQTGEKIPIQSEQDKFDLLPLEHETVVHFKPNDDYDRYMRLMGIGKKIETKKKFHIDLPLYEINVTQNRGLTLITKEQQIAELKQTLANRHGELDGIVKMVQHQSDIKAPPHQIKKFVTEKLHSYLKEYGYQHEIPGLGESDIGTDNLWTTSLTYVAAVHGAKLFNQATSGRFDANIDQYVNAFSTVTPSTATLEYENHPHAEKGKWTDVSSVSLLKDGPSATALKKKMIQEAKQEILISGSYCGGKIFDEFLDEIATAMIKNPQLRVYISSSTRFLSNDDGCQNWTKIKKLTEQYPDRFQIVLNHELQQINGANETKFISNHAKFMIADGKYMIFGGSGIVDRWALFDGAHTPTKEEQSQDPKLSVNGMIAKAFRDQDTALVDDRDGGLVETARLEFFKLMSVWDNFNQAHPETHPLQGVINEAKVKGGAMRTYHKGELHDFYQKIDRNGPVAYISEFHGSKSDCPAYQGVKAKLYANGPENSSNTFASEVVNLISQTDASSVIEINHMYIHFTEDVLNALKRALDRGVKIRLITNGYTENCPDVQKTFGHRNMHMIRELHGTEGRKNLEVYLWNVPQTTDHKKVLVVDDVVVNGSSNFGYKGLNSMSDYELNVVIKSKEFAKEQRDLNAEDLQHCKSVSMNEARSLPSVAETVATALHTAAEPRIG